MEHRFDTLAKALAGSISRREALGRLGGGVAGLLLSTLGLGKAWSDPAPNSQCNDFCRDCPGISPGHGFGECVSSCEACVNSTGGQLPCGCPASAGGDVRCTNCCVGVGDSCSSTAQCCPGLGLTCAQSHSGATVCCRGIGGACSSGADCCAETTNSCNNGTCGCFIAGTRVTMADGREKPIEQLRAGEQVLGPEGEVNRVVEIRRPSLGTRSLYSLNGSGHFVTAAHPFMTSEGWKAIDPAATARENPLLQVAPLRVGDLLVAMQPARVLAAAGGVALTDPLVPALVSVPLASLEARTDHPDTTLYNPRLDGSHAYFADGFLVHNK